MRLLLLATLLVYAAGCGDTPGQDHDHDHEEEHSDHDDDHGAHEARYGGQLVELGDHFANVEVVHDKADGALNLYILGAHAQKAVRLDAKSLQVTLTVAGGETLALECRPVADALTGETVGDTSRFEAKHKALEHVGSFQGKIADLTVSGQRFRDVAFVYAADE